MRYTPPINGTPPSLFRKLAEVQGGVAALHPDREVNTGQYTYSYITESALLNEIRGPLANRKIAVFVSVERQATTLVEIERANGRKANVAQSEVELHITFADGESGETATIVAQGRADDSADKSVYKAITSANRYAFWKTFLVPTDQDDVNQSQADYSYAARGRRPAEPPPAEGPPPQEQPLETSKTKLTTPTQRKTFADSLLVLQQLAPGRDWLDDVIRPWVRQNSGGREITELSRDGYDHLLAKVDGLIAKVREKAEGDDVPFDAPASEAAAAEAAADAGMPVTDTTISGEAP